MIEPSTLVCNTPATSVPHIATRSDAEKEIRRIAVIAKAGVYFIKGGLDETTLQKHLEFYALGRWSGTYMYNEKLLKENVHEGIHKANLEWFEPSKKSFAETVKEWARLQDGTFSLQNGYNELRLTTAAEKKHFRTVISRILEKGVIKKVGSQSGVYAPVKNELHEEDWKNANESKAPLWLPFDLES